MADAVSVAPDLYKVLLENDRVRVLEVRYGPGVKSDMIRILIGSQFS